MGVSQWFADRRPDAVSHGILGRVLYTAVVMFLGVEIFAITSFWGVLVGVVITVFAAVFAGIPFLVKVWAPSAAATKREIAERQRIDPEPAPRECKTPKRW
ncbi:MAG: hypothetical protein H6526_05025 [Actinobacteria bacterium]|nr:hypothetical protein [Actinomycetota bacterium]MCB8997232.1 hypothetical protein [Actinomycetota bacterium]MCB9414628.1 hypothetical protein [Actinomycetota bacterium]MCB9423544.1 hypothetical protein [Actinomycetota bacterium]HRY09040.1 hypothetical protein [Candidatus Nanopelagicales bacterium]